MTELTTREQQLIELEIMKKIHKVFEERNLKYYIMYGSLLGAIRHKGFIPWDEDIDITVPREDYERLAEMTQKEKIFDNDYVVQNYHTDPHFEFPITRICKKGTYSDNPSRKNLKSMNYVYIDIFPMDNSPDEESLQKKHRKKIKIAKKLSRFRTNYYYAHQSALRKILKTVMSIPFKALPATWYAKNTEKAMKSYNDTETKFIGSYGSVYPYNKETHLKKDFDERILTDFEDTKFWIPAGYDRILKNLYGDYMKLPPEEDRKSVHKAYLTD